MDDEFFLKNVMLFTEFEPKEMQALLPAFQRSHFEVNRALIESWTFREAYAMYNR